MAKNVKLNITPQSINDRCIKQCDHLQSFHCTESLGIRLSEDHLVQIFIANSSEKNDERINIVHIGNCEYNLFMPQ